MRGSTGASRLARVLEARMTDLGRQPEPPELGTIQADGALLLDRFAVPIPQGQYLVCRSLTLPSPLATTSAGGTDGHTHTVPRPLQLAPLTSGDRVLVAWVNGRDPVVVDVVVT